MKYDRWWFWLFVLSLAFGVRCVSEYGPVADADRRTGRRSLADRRIYIYEEIVQAHEAGKAAMVTRLLRKQFGLNPALFNDPDERIGYLVACYYGTRRFAEAAALVLQREGGTRRDTGMLLNDLAACIRNYAILKGVPAGVRLVEDLRGSFPHSQLLSVFWTVLPIEYVRAATRGRPVGHPRYWLDRTTFPDRYPASRADLERLYDRYPREPHREYAALMLRDPAYLTNVSRWGAIPHSYHYLLVETLLDSLQVREAPIALAITHGHGWPALTSDSLRSVLTTFRSLTERYLDEHPDRPGFGPASRYWMHTQLLLGRRAEVLDYLEELAAADRLTEVRRWRNAYSEVARHAAAEQTERLYRLLQPRDSAGAVTFLRRRLNNAAAQPIAARLLIATGEPDLQQAAYETLLNRNRDGGDSVQFFARFADYHDQLPQRAGNYLYRMVSNPRLRPLGMRVADRTEDNTLRASLSELLATIAYAQRDAGHTYRYTGDVLTRRGFLPGSLTRLRRWAELVLSVRELATVAEFEEAARRAKNELNDRELARYIIDTGLTRLRADVDLSYLLYLKILLLRDSRYYRQQRRAVALIDSLLLRYPDSDLADDALAERVYLQAVGLPQYFTLADAENSLAQLQRRYPDYPERNALDNAYNWLAMGYRQRCRSSSGQVARSACARSRELYEEMLQRFRFTRFYNYTVQNLRELDRLETADPLNS